MILRNYRAVSAGLGLLMTGAILSGPLAVAQNRTQVARLDAGTVIPVKLDRALNSKTNQKGDKFTATVKADSLAALGLPEGATVEGIVNEARPKKDKDPGVIDLAFQRLRLPNGRSYAITGSTIGLDNKSVTRTKDGRIVAKPSTKNNRLTYVGYGAGAGLLVSVLSGGKLHLENIALGAGLGYLLGSLEKNKPQPNDVNLKAGTEMGVRLDHSLRYASDDSGSYPSRTVATDTGGYQRGETTGGSPLDRPLDRPRNGDNPPATTQDTTSDIGVLVNDSNVKFDSTAPPVAMNGVVMVPVRPVLDAARIGYSFANNNSVIKAKGANGTVQLGVGSRIAVAGDGTRTRLDAEAKRMNGTIYVPIRFFELVTGQKATYDTDSKTVLISK